MKNSCQKCFRTLDKTISSLEVQLAAARAAKADNSNKGSPVVTKPGTEQFKERPKVFFVMGIITAFSSRKRRDSIRDTWMPQGLVPNLILNVTQVISLAAQITLLLQLFLGDELKRLETEKGIIIRFVIGHR